MTFMLHVGVASNSIVIPHAICRFIPHAIRRLPSQLLQSETYGDGFRLALDAYQAHGLVKLLAHVKQTGAFPTVA